MTREVKGTVMVDYAKMYRANKGLDWTKYLYPEDIKILEGKVGEQEWYPFETYERLGYAVFMLIGKGNPDSVRFYGAAVAQKMFESNPSFFRRKEPDSAVQTFLNIMKRFFKPEIYSVKVTMDTASSIKWVAHSVEKKSKAIEPYTLQCVGSAERIIRIVKEDEQLEITFEIVAAEWKGDDHTEVLIKWSNKYA